MIIWNSHVFSTLCKPNIRFRTFWQKSHRRQAVGRCVAISFYEVDTMRGLHRLPFRPHSDVRSTGDGSAGITHHRIGPVSYNLRHDLFSVRPGRIRDNENGKRVRRTSQDIERHPRSGSPDRKQLRRQRSIDSSRTDARGPNVAPPCSRSAF